MAKKVTGIEDHKVERVRHKILSGFMNKSRKNVISRHHPRHTISQTLYLKKKQIIFGIRY